MPKQRAQYDEMVAGFRDFIERVVEKDATLLVVTKGDHRLLDLPVSSAWHFPQGAGGAYAGYHPRDSAAAVSHLEALRSKGADALAVPSASLWWLDHYVDFRRHLETNYREFARDETGVVFLLASKSNGLATPRAVDPGPAENGTALHRDAAREPLEAVPVLFDPGFYAAGAAVEFGSPGEAYAHYLAHGRGLGIDPHPLFDVSWYVRQNPEVRRANIDPLIHFIERGAADGADPNPYFDTRYYLSQRPELEERGENALMHYIRTSPLGKAPEPNPLFQDTFYLRTYPDVRQAAGTPLEHFLRFGCDERRAGSRVHRNILNQGKRSSRGLTRGKWIKGTVLFVTACERPEEASEIRQAAEYLGRDHHVDSLLVACRAPAAAPHDARVADILLEDFALAADVFRPSALRLLTRSLTAMRPIFAVTDVPEVIEPLVDQQVASYFLLPNAEHLPPDDVLAAVVERARRVLAPSSAAFHGVAERLGSHPTNVARRAPAASVGARGRAGRRDRRAPSPGRALSDLLMDLAHADTDLRVTDHVPAQRAGGAPKVLIPCSDWSISGVNAALEAVGTELIERGWDVEIIFTRDEPSVLETAEGAGHLPRLPYRFLHRDKSGVPGMWEALIAEAELQAPCILLMAYDFLGNSVAPALTPNVGVVAWAQADDGDYYEQAYRLGLYCNAIVCVSGVIKDRIGALNPLIGERARVIHNTSIRACDIATRRPRRGKTLRLIYTGRLVQYQKRILDFIELAQSLDRTGVPYELSLVGTFRQREDAEETFHALAHEHLSDGRIKLRGRMDRDAIFEELTAHDFFVLLSDFEGLPLSLVEAMGRGCVPFVADSPSGIPDLVDSGENGIIMPGRDYDAWARLLTEIWADGRRHSAMSRRARATVRDRFTVEHAGAQFDSLLRDVLDDIESGAYERPPSLNWGSHRTRTGDVLPPPNLHRPGSLQIAGLK